MGFRSQLLSTYVPNPPVWPQWYRDKYPALITPTGHLGCAGTQVKTYHPDMKAFLGDTQDALTEAGWWNPFPRFELVWMHDCGGVVKIVLTADGAPRVFRVDRWMEMPPTHTVDVMLAKHEETCGSMCWRDEEVQFDSAEWGEPL